MVDVSDKPATARRAVARGWVSMAPETLARVTEGTAAKGELPTKWAGTWTSLLLPLVGIALFVLYFLFLRRRRKDE